METRKNAEWKAKADAIAADAAKSAADRRAVEVEASALAESSVNGTTRLHHLTHRVWILYALAIAAAILTHAQDSYVSPQSGWQIPCFLNS
jgi:hypothetical protein